MEAPPPPAHVLDWAWRGHPALWRHGLVLVIALVAWVVGGVPVLLLAGRLGADAGTVGTATVWTFLPGLLVLLALPPLLLGRPWWSLLAPATPLRWRDYATGILVGLVTAIIAAAASAPWADIRFVGWGGVSGLGLAGIALLLAGLVIQTGFEELLFRGLLMQLAWRLLRWPPLPILLPALLFAALHLGNIKAWSGIGLLAGAPYLLTALVWGWIVWRTGSLMVAGGLHFINNASNSLILGTEGDVLPPYAPLVMPLPSLGFGMGLLAAQLALTAVAVEGLVRRGVLPGPAAAR